MKLGVRILIFYGIEYDFWYFTVSNTTIDILRYRIRLLILSLSIHESFLATKSKKCLRSWRYAFVFWFLAVLDLTVDKNYPVRLFFIVGKQPCFILWSPIFGNWWCLDTKLGRHNLNCLFIVRKAAVFGPGRKKSFFMTRSLRLQI